MLRQIQDEILRLKKERDVTILAHSYQSADVTEVADFVGDSYALAQAAAKVKSETVILCGVRFMAEGVKLLCPDKRVFLSHGGAGCPMAEQLSPEEIRAYKRAHPDCTVVAYINTTAALKAECDVCVTSSSAVKIVSALPGKEILFIPDRNLGAYVAARVPDKTFGRGLPHSRRRRKGGSSCRKGCPSGRPAAGSSGVSPGCLQPFGLCGLHHRHYALCKGFLCG